MIKKTRLLKNQREALSKLYKTIADAYEAVASSKELEILEEARLDREIGSWVLDTRDTLSWLRIGYNFLGQPDE